MGWVEKPHRCDLPVIVHESLGKVGDWFECDHCKANWQVQARVLYDEYRNFALTYVRRVGDYIYTISWQES